VLTKGVSAEVQITLRSAGGTGRVHSVPLETFEINKEMGRVLIRRSGETVAAGTGFSSFSPLWFDPRERDNVKADQFNPGIVLSIDG